MYDFMCMIRLLCNTYRSEYWQTEIAYPAALLHFQDLQQELVHLLLYVWATAQTGQSPHNLLIAECFVRRTQTVIEGSSSRGGQLNVHDLLICNTVEFSRHSIRNLYQLIQLLGFGIRGENSNFTYRTALCNVTRNIFVVLTVGCSLFLMHLA